MGIYSVKWNPFVEHVFISASADGTVNVFDLNENKHEPLCDQKAVKKSKLTHVCFNPQEPIILVGDDKGWVNCLKLSPNLRKIAPPDKENPKSQKEMEVEKLTRILASAGKAQAEGSAQSSSIRNLFVDD